MTDNDRISGTQILIFIVLTAIGVGGFSLSRLTAEAADQDGWISVIVGGMIAVLNFYIMSRLAKRFPGDTLVEMTEKSVGKVLSIPLLLVFWVYMLLIGAMTLRVFGEVIKMSLLLKTPIEVINIFMMLLVLWLARGGIEPIARFNGVVFPLIMITIFFIMLFSIPGSDFTNILPVFRSGPVNIIKGAYLSTYSYTGYEFILLIIPFIRKPDKIFRSGVIALTLTALIYTGVVILSFAKFGVADTKKLIWPGLTLIRTIEVPGSFFERLEGVVMTLWILFVFTTLTPFLYSLSVLPSRMLRHREFKHFCAIIVPLVYILSLIPENVTETYEYINIIYEYLQGPSVFLLPILLLIVSSIRKAGVRHNG